MANHQLSIEAIRDRAAHWVQRVNDYDLTDAERTEFQAWLLTDERHATEFRAHNAPIGLARDLPSDLRARLDALLPLVHVDVPAPRRRWMWPAALAAVILVAVVSVGWFRMQVSPEGQIYATHTGENLTITLEDGSVAHLNTRTRVEWLGGSRERRVRLFGAGEAFFEVIYDPFRPFIVELDKSEVHVLGTKFNVYSKQSGEVTVTVKEGKVAVLERVNAVPEGELGPAQTKRLEVSANENISYREHGEMGPVQPVDPSIATAWRDGRFFVTEEMHLSEFVEELNRYTDKRIVLLDSEVGKLNTGGAFFWSVRDVRGTLKRLQLLDHVAVRDGGDRYTIRYR